MNNLHKEAMDMLLATSRTFYIPITRLTSGLQETVASAYLCMRAIDEIEDHESLPAEQKVALLRKLHELLPQPMSEEDLTNLFAPSKSILPPVTLRLWDWIQLTPKPIRPVVLHWTSVMAKGMADWVEKKFLIRTEDDLDSYTYYVAGLVGLMLNEIWKWYDGTKADQELAIGFGRGLQAVNIIRNRVEDQSRGVDFFPEGWSLKDMLQYAKRNLGLAKHYLSHIKEPTIREFCNIPLVLAYGTLEAIESGKDKLSRADVLRLVNQAVAE